VPAHPGQKGQEQGSGRKAALLCGWLGEKGQGQCSDIRGKPQRRQYRRRDQHPGGEVPRSIVKSGRPSSRTPMNMGEKRGRGLFFVDPGREPEIMPAFRRGLPDHRLCHGAGSAPGIPLRAGPQDLRQLEDCSPPPGFHRPRCLRCDLGEGIAGRGWGSHLCRDPAVASGKGPRLRPWLQRLH